MHNVYRLVRFTLNMRGQNFADFDALSVYLTTATNRRIAFIRDQYSLPMRLARLPVSNRSGLLDTVNRIIETERIHVGWLERKYYGDLYRKLRARRSSNGYGWHVPMRRNTLHV